MKFRYTKNGYDLNATYEIDGTEPDAIIDFSSIRNQSGQFVHLPETVREDLETEIIIARDADRTDAAYEKHRDRITA